MKGLIFNILSELSERAGCQDDAWEVALAGAALGDDEYEIQYLDGTDEGAQETPEEEDEVDEALEAEAFEMPYLEGEWGDSFRNIVRSASPFSESDWSHLPGTPVNFGRAPERRGSEAPAGERASFVPDPDPSDPYFLLMLSLGAKR